jgi:hypothetical protein
VLVLVWPRLPNPNLREEPGTVRVTSEVVGQCAGGR